MNSGGKDELITVQLISRQITLADEERDRDELGRGNVMKRERFNLYPPKEDADEHYDDERERTD